MTLTKSKPFTKDEINQLKEQFEVYIKSVIDIEKKGQNKAISGVEASTWKPKKSTLIPLSISVQRITTQKMKSKVKPFVTNTCN